MSLILLEKKKKRVVGIFCLVHHYEFDASLWGPDNGNFEKASIMLTKVVR